MTAQAAVRQTNSPVTAHQGGRLVKRALSRRCPKRLKFYFSAHLKELSVTLIRAVVNSTQCFLPIQGPPLAPATIYWEKSGYICSCNLSADLTSWCPSLMCPLNPLQVFFCARRKRRVGREHAVADMQADTQQQMLHLTKHCRGKLDDPCACSNSNQTSVAMVRISFTY